ncbi:MAG: monovalent cation:proton antiporter-2 (CPA2) family protein [Hyphomicrobiaceae bacterium]
MERGFLTQAAVLLGAAAVAAPLGRRLHVGSVLGYIAAGVAIGPSVLRLFYDVESVLAVAELGVVFLLFLIGLELRPIRLWSMRRTIFGAGSVQVLATGAIIGAIAYALGVAGPAAAVVGLALALSSTAFALQVLEEKKELGARHGRIAFAILLFQDLASIPLIALVPLIAARGSTSGAEAAVAVGKAIGVIAMVVLFGRFALDRIYRIVAASGVREAMTASALLTVIGVALLMQLAGLSAALGAFIAGALLAESEYRHQIEADIQPFEGLLLGLFFIAIGMSIDLGLLQRELPLILAWGAALLVVKGAVLHLVGRWQGLDGPSARRLALTVSQGGEFAFVILGLVVGARLLDAHTADRLVIVVTLSMAATPLLLLVDDAARRLRKPAQPEYETPHAAGEGHVVIAGFGRVGQIVGRILRAKGIPFTALDIDPEQVSLVKRFGNEAYYGDASRLDILQSARTDKARAFVLAIDDVETSLKTADVVRRHFPHVPVYARARNRRHIYRLMDLGVTSTRRETFLSSVDITREVLRGLGTSEAEVRRITETFVTHDRKRLYDDYRHASDFEKLAAQMRKSAEELEELLREDIQPAKPEKTQK